MARICWKCHRRMPSTRSETHPHWPWSEVGGPISNSSGCHEIVLLIFSPFSLCHHFFLFAQQCSRIESIAAAETKMNYVPDWMDLRRPGRKKSEIFTNMKDINVVDWKINIREFEASRRKKNGSLFSSILFFFHFLSVRPTLMHVRMRCPSAHPENANGNSFRKNERPKCAPTKSIFSWR